MKRRDFPKTVAGAFAGLTIPPTPSSAVTGEAFGSPLIYEPSWSYEEWAELFMEFEGDRFRFRPYQRQPARDIFNPRLLDLAIQAYSGWGKTVIVAGAFAYAIEQLAIQIGLMYPTTDTSKERLRDKFWPILTRTPRVKRLKFRKGLRGDINLAFDKQWANGARLQAVGSNSFDKIRTMEPEMVYADEIDSFVGKITDEGDAVDALFGRTRDKRTQIHLATSFPGRKNFSKIEKMVEDSDFCQWHVPCWHCGEWFLMHTNMITWPDGKPEKAEVACPECERGISDDQRIQMSEAGAYADKHGNWIEEHEDAIPPDFQGHRGYKVNCMVHVGVHREACVSYLHELATLLEAIPNASNPVKSERVFVNQRDAESFAEPVEEKPEPDWLYMVREPYDPYKMLPAEVLCLTAAVDVQGNRLECEVVGHGENGETWGCGYRIFHGSPLLKSTWNKLWKYLARPRPHPSGQRMTPAMTFVDSAYLQNDVFKAIIGRVRTYGIKGSLTHGGPILGKSSKVGSPKTTQITIGTHEAKAAIYSRALLACEDHSEGFPFGYQHFPKHPEYGPNAGETGDGYFEMFLVEDAVIKQTPTGSFEPWFSNPGKKRNEPLDLWVYNMAAVIKLKPDFERLAEKYAVNAPKSGGDTEKSLSNAARKGNFATDWK